MLFRSHVQIPEPNKHVTVDVRQLPGYSYPAMPNRVHITEQSVEPSLNYGHPRMMRHELLPSGDASCGASCGASCP